MGRSDRRTRRSSSLGIQPFQRTAVLVDPPEGADISSWPAVIDIDENFYFKPDAGKLLLSPADEQPVAPCDAQPDELDVAIAVDRVERATTLHVRRVDHSWAGLRSFAPDRLPAVGFDPRTRASSGSRGKAVTAFRRHPL